MVGITFIASSASGLLSLDGWQPKFDLPTGPSPRAWFVCVGRSDVSIMRCTLGHKANHSDRPNAEFDWTEHPRFGSIRTIVTIRAIEAGEEITVDYGYGGFVHQTPPGWFGQRGRPATDNAPH